MKYSYEVTEAHSGTSAKEIAKAKRLFLENVKSGLFVPYMDKIGIVFSDVNYVITATFYDILDSDDSHKIGSVKIN